MSKIEHDTQAASDRPVDYGKPYFHRAISVLEEQKIKSPTILDIGAGNGEFAELVKKRISANVTCIDYAKPHLDRLSSLGFKTLEVDFDDSKMLKNVSEEMKSAFDVVTAFEFIEHCFGLDDFLAFAHTVLKPGGLILISTPNLDHSFYHIHSLLLGNIPMGEGHHVRFFNRRRLTQALTLDGFEVIEERSYGLGNAYAERVAGEGGKFWKLVLRVFGRLIYEITPSSSSKKYSKLVLIAKKVNTPLMGFDQTWRTPNYKLLSDQDKKKLFSRLIKFRNQKLFRDMPGFRKFFDMEYHEHK